MNDVELPLAMAALKRCLAAGHKFDCFLFPDFRITPEILRRLLQCRPVIDETIVSGTIVQAVWIANAVFVEGIDLNDIRRHSAPALYLENCEFPYLNLRNSRIDGLRITGGRTNHIDLSESIIGSTVEIREVLGNDTLFVRGNGVRIEGNLKICDIGLVGVASPHPEASECSLDIVGAKINGTVDLHPNFRSKGLVRATGAIIEGDVNLTNALLETLDKKTLVLDEAEVKGSILIRSSDHGAFTSKGAISLRAVSAHDLDAAGAKIESDDHHALIMSGGRLRRHLLLFDIDSPELSFECRGRFAIANSHVEGMVDASFAEIDGMVSFQSTHIRRDLRLKGVRFSNKNSVALYMPAAHVGETLNLGPAQRGDGLRFSTFDGFIDARRVVVDGDIDAIGITVTARATSIAARSLRCSGDVKFAAYQHEDELVWCDLQGSLDLRKSVISGDLILRRMSIGSPGQRSVRLDLASIEGDLIFGSYVPTGERPSLIARGPIEIEGASVGGETAILGLECIGERSALSLTGCRVSKGIVVGSFDGSSVCSFMGSVDFQKTMCGDDIAINSGHFDGKGRSAIILDACNIEGHVKIGSGAGMVVTKGPVTLFEAKIGGRLDIHHVILEADYRVENEKFDFGLLLDRCEIRHGFHLGFKGSDDKGPSRLAGDLSMTGASIKGDLQVNNFLLFEFDAAGCEINGNVSINTICSQIDFSGARVSGNFCGERVRFVNIKTGLPNLALSQATITGSLHLNCIDWVDKDANSPDGKIFVDLRGANVETVDCRFAEWCKDTVVLLDNLRYRNVEFKYETDERHRRFSRRASGPVRFLRWQYPSARPAIGWYRSQPYDFLSKHLSGKGLASASRRVLMEKYRVEALSMPPVTRAVYRFLFGGMFGYGISASRALVTLLIYVGLGTLLAQKSIDIGLMTLESQPASNMLATDNSGTPTGVGLILSPPIGAGKVLEAVSCDGTITPWVYALDLAIPVLDLNEESKCGIRQSNSSDPGMFTNFTAFIKHPDVWKTGRGAYAVIGWIISSLALLTVAGVFRWREN